MKKMTLIFGISGVLCFAGCGGSDESTEGIGADSTATAITPNEDGVYEGADLGNYLLYGLTQIDDQGEIAELSAMNSAIEKGGFQGKVSVQIAEVCQKAGCWIVFNNENGEPVRVFFRDHFTIPIETASGTNAILYGMTKVDTISVDFQKHLLDDAVEAGTEVSQEEYDGETTISYQFKDYIDVIEKYAPNSSIEELKNFMVKRSEGDDPEAKIYDKIIDEVMFQILSTENKDI